MRVILIYDLHFDDEDDIKNYNKFRKNILKIGFYMIQESVYTKVLTNETSYVSNYNKLMSFVPDRGSIIIFKLTEKQFQDMQYLNGIKNKQESIVGGKELVIFGGDDN